jgi:signal transduction histidine kinase/CheY-like chemotaxis protein
VASPIATDSALPARDLLAREKILLQQARLGQSVRLRYLIVAVTGIIELVGIVTGAFTTPWPVFFVLWVLALAVNFAVDMARRNGWRREWHFTAMLVLDTLFIGAHAMAVRQFAYLGLLFFIVAAQGYSLGLPRAARFQLLLGCIVYPVSRVGGLWLLHSRLSAASIGAIVVETICLGGLGWVAISAPIRFTKRLRRTRHALDVLSEGAFDTRLPVGSVDDLDFLAASFNHTAEALAQSAAQLMEQEAQLRELHKLEAVGRLAGGIAHDFNNIHTVVLANLELASSEIPASSPAHADVQEAVRATRTAADLTQQLLAFGRKQILRPEILDLRTAVDGISPVIARLAGTNIRVVTELATVPCLTRADASQLMQALLNLATNARDAMQAASGTLTITVAPGDLQAARARGAFVLDDPSRQLRSSGARADAASGEVAEEWVMLSVRDTGAGMDADTLVRVFEPFFSTKGIGLGSGLGLATVQGIVAQSGGIIAVESVPGSGTTFSIYLPAVHAAAPALPRVARPATTPSKGAPMLERSADRNVGVVLLVEDEPTVRISTRRILERAGYQVVEAADGVEALKRFASRESGKDESGPPVQILVTDLMMPNLGGAELATQLRTHRPDLPIILMSGYSEDAVLGDGMTIPDAVFIGKPPQRHELVAAMARLLRRGPPLEEAVA